MAGPEVRRREILAALAERGAVAVRELARTHGVAAMTIRRDLEALEREGLIERTHGGAVAADRVAYEFSFQEKEGKHVEAKRRIALACARMVSEGQSVFLDSGSTALEIARALRERRPGLLVTHNLCVVSEYLYQRDTRVLVPGGELNPLAPDLFGELTYAALGRINVDLAFLGADAVDPEAGLFTPDLKSATISEIVAANARRVVLAADSSKFGLRSNFQALDIAAFSAIVTDRELSAAMRKTIRRQDVELVLA